MPVAAELERSLNTAGNFFAVSNLTPSVGLIAVSFQFLSARMELDFLSQRDKNSPSCGYALTNVKLLCLDVAGLNLELKQYAIDERIRLM